jgi:hypothetical protein
VIANYEMPGTGQVAVQAVPQPVAPALAVPPLAIPLEGLAEPVAPAAPPAPVVVPIVVPQQADPAPMPVIEPVAPVPVAQQVRGPHWVVFVGLQPGIYDDW